MVFQDDPLSAALYDPVRPDDPHGAVPENGKMVSACPKASAALHTGGKLRGAHRVFMRFPHGSQGRGPAISGR